LDQRHVLHRKLSAAKSVEIFSRLHTIVPSLS
jgi:hypothetical protein